MLWWRKDLSVTIFVQKILDMPLVGWKVDYCNYTCGIYNRKNTTERVSLCFALHLYIQRTEQKGLVTCQVF